MALLPKKIVKITAYGVMVILATSLHWVFSVRSEGNTVKGESLLLSLGTPIARADAPGGTITGDGTVDSSGGTGSGGSSGCSGADDSDDDDDDDG